MTLFKLADLESALEQCEKAIEKDKTNGKAWVRKANIWSSKGDEDKALNAYKKALSLLQIQQTIHKDANAGVSDTKLATDISIIEKDIIKTEATLKKQNKKLDGMFKNAFKKVKGKGGLYDGVDNSAKKD
jgi:tetratricopeptide (TPR) repeat protein